MLVTSRVRDYGTIASYCENRINHKLQSDSKTSLLGNKRGNETKVVQK